MSTSIFGHLLSPRLLEAGESSPAHCTRKATGMIPHSRDKKPVMLCETRSKAKVYLCAGCKAALEAERDALAKGYQLGSAHILGALIAIRGAVAGYVPPKVGYHAPQAWHAAKQLVSLGFARRVQRTVKIADKETIEILFARPDACLDPTCLRADGTHSESCALAFGDAFMERSTEQLAKVG